MLYKQLVRSELEQMGVPTGTGLEDILETIRIHWERDVEKNQAEAGALLQTKVRGSTSTLHSAPCRRRPAKDEKQSVCKKSAMVSTSLDLKEMQFKMIACFPV